MFDQLKFCDHKEASFRHNGHIQELISEIHKSGSRVFTSSIKFHRLSVRGMLFWQVLFTVARVYLVMWLHKASLDHTYKKSKFH